MLRRKNQVNFDPDTKNESFSTATQKTCQIRSLHWIQANFHHSHNQINSIPTTVISSSSIPRTVIKSILTPAQKQLNLDRRKTPSQWIATLKQVIFAPHKKY